MKPSAQENTLAAWARRGCATGVLVLAMLMRPTEAQAQVFTYASSNGTITITGYTGTGGAVTIPSTITGLPVTSIGERAFFYATGLTSITILQGVITIDLQAFLGCSSLTNISIPDSVTSIGFCSFQGCTNLTQVTIPNSVTNILGEAFSGCTGLTNLAIPGGVAYVADGAFEFCTSLTSVTISNASIGDHQFFGCSNLASVTIGNRVKTIGNGAFENCTSLTSITIPDSVSTISDGYSGWWAEGAFSLCTSLTNVTFGQGVTNIGDNAFFACTSLVVVRIPDGVGRIGFHAFTWCTGLKSVTIPGSVVNIENENTFAPYAGSPFADCSSLTAITVDPLNPAYSSLDGVLFNKSQTTLLAYSGGKAGSYTIPGTVTNVEGHAFYGSAGLTSVAVADSVTRIGSYAFWSCPRLTGVTIGKGVANLEEESFFDCTALKGVYFRGNAPSLGLSAFDMDTNTIIYYLPGTSGWGLTFGGRPTALWDPNMQPSDATFVVKRNSFGFNINGTADIPLVIEASTNLAGQSWVPLQTSTLTNGLIYFSDPQWTNYPSRVYRIRSP